MKNTLIATVIVLFAATSFADTFNYDCSSFDWNGDKFETGSMSLVVNGTSASADIREVSWDTNLGGTLNPNYVSRGNKKFVKFGTNLILEETLLSGGTELARGRFGGIARVEGQAEGGYYSYKFNCFR